MMNMYFNPTFEEVEAKQFLPPEQIPVGVSDVYEMGQGSERWHTGSIWRADGERQGVTSGEWIIYKDGQVICSCHDSAFKFLFISA